MGPLSSTPPRFTASWPHLHSTGSRAVGEVGFGFNDAVLVRWLVPGMDVQSNLETQAFFGPRPLRSSSHGHPA